VNEIAVSVLIFHEVLEFLGIFDHCAKLQHFEGSSLLADAFMPKEDWAPAAH
jgi:hypothetical protein